MGMMSYEMCISLQDNREGQYTPPIRYSLYNCNLFTPSILNNTEIAARCTTSQDSRSPQSNCKTFLIYILNVLIAHMELAFDMIKVIKMNFKRVQIGWQSSFLI